MILNVIITIEGKWSSPTISGQCLPPCFGFTLTILSNNKAVLYGGAYYDNDASSSVYNNNLYTIEMTRDTVVSVIYCAIIISNISTG